MGFPHDSIPKCLDIVWRCKGYRGSLGLPESLELSGLGRPVSIGQASDVETDKQLLSLRAWDALKRLAGLQGFQDYQGP